MGFACVSMRLLPGEAYVATIGPYLPSDARGWEAGLDPLAYDAQSGAAAVGLDPDDAPPGWLADISAVPADAVYEVAAWLAEEIARCHADCATADADADEEREGAENEPKRASRPRRARPNKRSRSATDPALAFVLTLTEGDAAATRRSVDAVLAEVRAAGRRTNDISRLRLGVAAFAARALAAAEHAGLDTRSASAHLADFARELDAAEEAGSAEALRSALLGFLGTFRREAQRAGETDEVIARMSAAIEERLPGKVTLAETARLLGRSPTSLTHRLQRRFGLSFTEYVGRLRVERAKALLRDTSLTTAEIGARVGVDDSGNFGRLFRRHEGVSPSAYRARIRKGT